MELGRGGSAAIFQQSESVARVIEEVVPEATKVDVMWDHLRVGGPGVKLYTLADCRDYVLKRGWKMRGGNDGKGLCLQQIETACGRG